MFVLLPQDIRDPISTEEWSEFLAPSLAQAGLRFVDLSKEFRNLPVGTRRAMMDERWGHFSIQGHDWVAAQLGDQVRRLSALATRGTAGRGESPHAQ
jgi:hypothetical protein